MYRSTSLCLLLAAGGFALGGLGCGGGDVDSASTPVGDLVDVTERLGAGQSRAGLIRDERALGGGFSADGALGDVRIYNDRVSFVIQGVRHGHYAARQGGGVIDADLVRPEGQPGRDFVDEWMPMAGTGHIADPTSVTVVDDGAESGVAVVRVEGDDSALEYLTGAVESDSVVPDMGLRFVTEYRLPADSWLMEVETTVTAGQVPFAFQIGDAILGGAEAADMWASGAGYVSGAPDSFGWVGFVGRRNEAAIGVLPAAGVAFQPNATMNVVSGLLAVAGAFGPDVSLAPGESASALRYYGVAPDPATLTDAMYDIQGVGTDVQSGQVRAGDAPVAGARVNVLVDGLPVSMAFTDENGEFSARSPAGADVTLRAAGRGPGLFLDLPEGAGPYAPYTGPSARALALQSLSEGALPVTLAQGFGVAEEATPLELIEPGRVTVSAADGLPFEARFSYADGDPVSVDGALVQPRPHGRTALAWSRDGVVDVLLEPGVHTLVAHRGARYELTTVDVTVVSGETSPVDVTFDASFETPGWLVADPHMHSAPSPDGKLPMSDRLMVAAGTGVQLPFGTDHDHIVDYNPLVGPLGLGAVLNPIVATEVSPVMRGHVNAYPLTPVEGAPNGGGFLWWENRVEDTEEQFGLMRAQLPDAIFQLNHPLAGLPSFAQWSEGEIAKPDFWTEDFDAIEVMNGGGYADEFVLYLDLVNRGLLPAPVGVSDSHKHLSGGPGLNITWLGVGVDDPNDVGDERLRRAFRARRTVASTGPYLQLSVDPGSEITGGTDLAVQALSPSWIVVDRLELWFNGELVEQVDGTEATFSLWPDDDAAYVVVARGDTPMSPVSSTRPWAMTSAILVDVAGDGWTSPLPALSLD